MKLEFHHINLVSKDVSKLHDFYTKILQLENIPVENFPRPQETKNAGYSGEIKFATDGSVQMHLAEKDLNLIFVHAYPKTVLFLLCTCPTNDLTLRCTNSLNYILGRDSLS